MRRAHEEHVAADIEGPDEYGAFPGSWLHILFGEPLLIVPDANVLRQDLDWACNRDRLGVLIAALMVASSGSFARNTYVREVEKAPRRVGRL